MEFLSRHQILHRPGGVEILINKTVAHDDLTNTLSQPRRLWNLEGITIEREGKNRLGHGPLRVGLTTHQVFIKEFLPKSSFDTAISLGRPSRAAKAFAAGLEMRHRGLPTPEPLAAVTIRRAGWVRRCWLITEWIEATTTLREIMDHPDRHQPLLDIVSRERLLEDLGRLLRQMSDAHVCHRDLSLRNILVTLTGDRPCLTIIDLNRVLTLSEARWTTGLAARNLERLRLSDPDFDRVLCTHFPDPTELDAHRRQFETARRRHRAYKTLKKLPRRRT